MRLCNYHKLTTGETADAWRPAFRRLRIPARRCNREIHAFTMVEIALSIAVVAFALVAILGVLPTGMTVQKDNREDNIINQEGRYWMEALRSGALVEDLTNYVESITITNLTKPAKSVVFDNTPSTPLRPGDVIALLSMPKYNQNGDTNKILA